jgi:2,4-diaminopentanoate dehydrogenase
MPYRVIQWATGAMGKSCLRAVIDHPDLELVGLFVYSPAKQGLDAGEIARRERTGVIATGSVEEILTLEADVVIHAARLQPPYAHHNEMLCRLLSSGKNVISINGHSYPAYWGERYRQPFEDACRLGGSTLFGTGLNPGFIVEKITAVATGLCSRLDTVRVTEVVDCRPIRNPNYVFDILGFGSEPGRFDPNDPTWPPAEILNGMYMEVVAHLVRRFGLTPETVKTDHRMLPATTTIETAAGIIPKGRIGHTNWCWHGIVDGRPLVTLSIHWVMEQSHLSAGEDHFWQVEIKGLPEVSITIDLRNPPDFPYRTTPEQPALASVVIGSIPAVCKAEPGIMTTPVMHPYQTQLD